MTTTLTVRRPGAGDVETAAAFAIALDEHVLGFSEWTPADQADEFRRRCCARRPGASGAAAVAPSAWESTRRTPPGRLGCTSTSGCTFSWSAIFFQRELTEG